MTSTHETIEGPSTPSSCPPQAASLPKLSASQRSQLGELIDQLELAADAGETLSPASLCAGSPELLPHLIDAIRRLRTFDARLSTLPSLPIPEQIGEFIVLEAIGTGATGMVFRCRQQNPDREVAVKVLTPLLNVDEQRERFQREMAAVASVREDGMAAVYQTGFIEWCGIRCLWISMELLDGGTICDFVRRHSVPEPEVLKLFRTVCETLRAAHRVGILHRDIKPSNILMSEEGLPHLVDFGIAKLPLTTTAVQHTETGGASARGTAAWMAPELLLDVQPVRSDVRSEIFSLGVVLFEMVSGQHPFGAETLSVPQVSVRIARQQQMTLQELRPDVSPDLVAFLEKLMAFRPEDRYQNLDDVLNDLARLQIGEPVAARSISSAERMSIWCRRHWGRFVVVTIASVLLLSVPSMSIYAYRTNQKLMTSRKIADRFLFLIKELSMRPALAGPREAGDSQKQLTVLREAGLAFEDLLLQWPEDREIRGKAGSAYHLLGIAAHRMRLEDESLASFQRAEQIFAGLKGDFPDDAELEFDLFHTVFGQAGTMLGTRQSHELHEWCHQLIRRLHQDEPENTDYTDALACVLVELGNDHAVQQDFLDLKLARERTLESHQLALGLASHPNCKPLHRKHIASSASVLRVIAHLENKESEAQEWAAVAVAAQERFVQDFSDPDSRSTLINYYLAHTSASLDAGKTQPGRESFDKAVVAYEAILPFLKGVPVFLELESNLRLVEAALERAEADIDRPSVID